MDERASAPSEIKAARDLIDLAFQGLDYCREHVRTASDMERLARKFLKKAKGKLRVAEENEKRDNRVTQRSRDRGVVVNGSRGCADG